MAITPNFSIEELKSRTDAFLKVVEKMQIKRMQQLGELCVIEARTNKGYMMQTGALLSSTGYGVYVDGVAVHSAFEAAQGAQAEAAQKGMADGQKLLDKVGKTTKGVALIVVAGENYAFYVETKGYNVLRSAERLAERELPRLMSKLANNINKAAE